MEEPDTKDTQSCPEPFRDASGWFSTEIPSFQIRGSFTCTINVTIFVRGTFDLFNVMCKQHNRNMLNPFLNHTQNGDIEGTCKRTLKMGAKWMIQDIRQKT